MVSLIQIYLGTEHMVLFSMLSIVTRKLLLKELQLQKLKIKVLCKVHHANLNWLAMRLVMMIFSIFMNMLRKVHSVAICMILKIKKLEYGWLVNLLLETKKTLAKLLFEGFSVEEVIDHTKQDFHVVLDLTGLEAQVQISDGCSINLLKHLVWFLM
ncbi:uncharacterized protein LOC114167496 [Vigna unguiculata]|uniref:uncharacterized protein LOC114167496 n=1 Tax=Vigna unguiculata TaxID=3917 RepID=UPI0010166EC3|nr:uncharacterized protein LOC114167496 [Vigna unguiculata]